MGQTQPASSFLKPTGLFMVGVDSWGGNSSSPNLNMSPYFHLHP